MREIKFWNAIIIALLVGCFGIQHFYVKQTFWGIMGVLFFWTCIPSIVALIQIVHWVWIGQDEFNNRFNGKMKDKQIITD